MESASSTSSEEGSQTPSTENESSPHETRKAHPLIKIASTLKEDNSIIGLSKGTIAMLQLSDCQYVLVCNDKLRTILRILMDETEDYHASISSDVQNNLQVCLGDAITISKCANIKNVSSLNKWSEIGD
jgi:hypothetical protein